MARTSLPPGFRFHPTDVELIMYYLKRKVMGKKLHLEAIAEVNIYNFSPWDLPDKSCLRNKDLEWYFFCPRERKYSSGARVKRATENGYWKTTGKERPVVYNDRNVGSVKTLVFHLGHAPKGDRTDWVIHEYRIIDDQLLAAGVQDSYVLCKVFKKSGLGPKNGAQYGAPFNEADWEDDEVNDCQDLSLVFTSAGPSLTLLVSENQSSVVKGLCGPEGEGALEQSLIEDSPVERQGSVTKSLDDIGATSGVSLIGEGPSALAGPATTDAFFDMSEDEVFRLFSAFTDDSALLSDKNGSHKYLNEKRENKSLPCLDKDIFNGLEDLENDFYPHNHILLQDNLGYIELNDLLSPLDYTPQVTGTYQSNDIFGSYNHENMLQQFCFAGGSAGINQYDYSESVLPVAPNKENSSFDGLQMVNKFYYGHNGVSDSEFTQSQPVNGENRRQHTDQDKKRGKQKRICTPRLLESTPSWSPITAQQSSPLWFPCYYDSSIHIKAEVTYGTGECTKDALSGMMEESSSTLWNQPWAQVLLFSIDVGSHPFSCFWFVFVSVNYFCHCFSTNSSFVYGTNNSLTNLIVLAKLLIDKNDHEKNDFFMTKRKISGPCLLPGLLLLLGVLNDESFRTFFWFCYKK